jgi:hypothetical protein
MKVAQELLRPSNVSITLELHQQADQEAKRAAQTRTSGLFVVRSEALAARSDLKLKGG